MGQLRVLLLVGVIALALAGCGESRTTTCTQSNTVLEDRASCTQESTSDIESWWNGLSPTTRLLVVAGAVSLTVNLVRAYSDGAGSKSSPTGN